MIFDKIAEQFKTHYIKHEVFKETVDDIRKHSLLIMSDREMQKDKAFRQYHYITCRNGNHFQYDLTGVGVGTIIEITCPKCGIKEDITDIDSW